MTAATRPAHDPAAWRTVPASSSPIDHERVQALLATEWERFTALVNTPVQGGCADGLKQALIDLSAALPDGAKIISTVHDEIIVECSQAQAEALRALLPATMRNAMAALFPQVPIEVEANICRHWGDKA